MWTVVYIAQNKVELDKIQNALMDEGLLTKIRQVGKDKNGQGLYEILVPQSEVDDASLILTSIAY